VATLADWNENAQGISGIQTFINRLVWDNGYTQVVGSQTRGDVLLDVYLVRPENSLVSCSIVYGTSDQCGVLLEVEWGEICHAQQVERLVPVFHKTHVGFVRDKFARWAKNGSCVKEIGKKFKEIVFERIGRFVPQQIIEA
jgi:hypothetical protein